MYLSIVILMVMESAIHLNGVLLRQKYLLEGVLLEQPFSELIGTGFIAR